MEQKQYFTPAIEDLYVGYELESHTWCTDEIGDPNLNWNRWDTTILSSSYLQTILKYGVKSIRVPYLTKEQIEKEGWKVTYTEVKPAPYKVNWIKAEKGDYELYINLALTDVMSLHIDQIGKGIKYRGTCPSINEFRTICKLLNIK